MRLSIITLSMGRWRYLLECVQSVQNELDFDEKLDVMQHVILQGIKPPKEIVSALRKYNCNLHFLTQNIGVGAAMNSVLPQCQADLIMKMDEDCKILTCNFFDHIFFMAEKFPNSVFSPFPLGLQNNLGGVKGYAHDVVERNYYEDKIYYQRRLVKHVGGFARFAPKHIHEKFKFTEFVDKTGKTSAFDDTEFSTFCEQSNIEMFYMDTHAAVEHNEGTCGQKVRYQEYFKDRR